MIDSTDARPDPDAIRLRYLLNDRSWPIEDRVIDDDIVMAFLWNGADLFVLPNTEAFDDVPAELIADLFEIADRLGTHPEVFEDVWLPVCDRTWVMVYEKSLVNLDAELRTLVGA